MTYEERLKTLLDAGSEFSKLDHVDRLLTFDVLENGKMSIKAFVHFIANEYKKKDRTIDEKKMTNELTQFMKYAEGLDDKDLETKSPE